MFQKLKYKILRYIFRVIRKCRDSVFKKNSILYIVEKTIVIFNLLKIIVFKLIKFFVNILFRWLLIIGKVLEKELPIFSRYFIKSLNYIKKCLIEVSKDASKSKAFLYLKKALALRNKKIKEWQNMKITLIKKILKHYSFQFRQLLFPLSFKKIYKIVIYDACVRKKTFFKYLNKKQNIYHTLLMNFQIDIYVFFCVFQGLLFYELPLILYGFIEIFLKKVYKLLLLICEYLPMVVFFICEYIQIQKSSSLKLYYIIEKFTFNYLFLLIKNRLMKVVFELDFIFNVVTSKFTSVLLTVKSVYKCCNLFLRVKVFESKRYIKKLNLNLTYFVSKFCFKFNQTYYKYMSHQFYDTKIAYGLKHAVRIFASIFKFICSVLVYDVLFFPITLYHKIRELAFNFILNYSIWLNNLMFKFEKEEQNMVWYIVWTVLSKNSKMNFKDIDRLIRQGRISVNQRVVFNYNKSIVKSSFIRINYPKFRGCIFIKFKNKVSLPRRVWYRRRMLRFFYGYTNIYYKNVKIIFGANVYTIILLIWTNLNPQKVQFELGYPIPIYIGFYQNYPVV